MKKNTCVCCDNPEILPEGSQVCYNCEHNTGSKNESEGLGALFSKKDVRDYRIDCVSAPVEFPSEFELKMPKVKNQGSVNSCHDKDTEVLTKAGWKLFKDITKEDLLASVNPSDGNLIFEHPVNIIKERYIGEMILGQHQSLNFMVTPNHKMVIRKWNEQERKLSANYSFVDADKLGWCAGLRTEFYQNKNIVGPIILEEEKISNGNILPRIEIDMYDWVQLLGIYLAEGTLYKDGPKYDYRIQLAAVKQREKDFIRDLLKRIGINGVNEQKDRFHFHNKRIWEIFESYGLVGVKSYDKFIPEFIFDLDESYIKKFLYAYAMGDGHFKKQGGVSYFTSSKIMAEQIQILLLMSGTYNKIVEQKPKTKNKPRIEGREITAKHIVYVINGWFSNNLSINKKLNIKNVMYDGYVYCAEVPTYHTLITRRNKCILLSGNCVGHSIATVIEYFNNLQQNSNEEMSVGYIYGNRTNTTHSGQGMYTRDAIAATCKYGDVAKKLFPYNEEVPDIIEKFNEQSDALFDKGQPNRFTSYYRLYNDNEIKTSLMNNGPVIFAMKWYDDIKVVDGVITTSQKADGGGHCMVIYGWDERGWKIMNSWGVLWGKGGKAILPYNIKIREAWGIIDTLTGTKTNVVKPYNNKVGNMFAKILNFFINIGYVLVDIFKKYNTK